MIRVHRTPSVLSAFLVPLLALTLLPFASVALAESHETEAKPAPEASAPAAETSHAADQTTAGTEGGVEDDKVVGGRDITPHRDPKIVWSEMLQIRDKMYDVADDRDMRAIVLTPQEQALFVAFSKRLYDLSKELVALTRPDLDEAGRIRVHRSMVQFRSTLGELRSIAGSEIHRGLPDALRRMSLQMKGVWASFGDSEKLLGAEGLPTTQELSAQAVHAH